MFSCEFCKIYQNSFFIEHLETAGNILKSQAFYRFLLNRNFHPFIFIFFKESFVMNFQGFLFVVNCIGLKAVSVTSWILHTAKIKCITESFWVKRIFEIDSSRSTYLIIHIHFESSQPLVSLKIKAVASSIRETWTITPTNLLKENLTYS